MPELDDMSIGHYFAARLGLDEQQSGAWHALLQNLFAQLEEGHTLLNNNKQRQALIKQLPSPLVCNRYEAEQGQVSPLVVDEDYIWLQRIWQAEYYVVTWIMSRLSKTPNDIVQKGVQPFLQGLKQKQKEAVLLALTKDLTIINGGPGTGKTYTIAKLVQALLFLNPKTKIHLAAPTGKAANRMEISLHQSLPPEVIAQLPAAKTIHALLGIVPGKGARYDKSTPLDLDVLIIDEASMLSLELMQQLVSALPEYTKVILLGDANQLAAVEPGAVLHDMTRSPILAPAVVTLTESNRFADDSIIGQLAQTALAGDEQTFFNIMTESSQLWQQGDTHSETQVKSLYDTLFAGYQAYIDILNSSHDVDEIFATFEQYRILCAGKAGNLGARVINKMMRQRHLAQLGLSDSDDYYHGLPLMVLVNQPHLKLYNGDIGLCLANAQGETKLYFPNHDETIAIDRINRKHIEDAYAFSIHKSQGSEFDNVAVCVDMAQQRLMSRELLYTAMTRAKKTLSFYGKQSLFVQAVNTPTQRLTGIHVQLSALQY